MLRTHRLTQHPRPEVEVGEQPEDPAKTHRCGKCGRGFETESELLVHQENHGGDQQCNGSNSPVKKRGRPTKTEVAAGAEKKVKRKKDEAEATEEAVEDSNTLESGVVPVEAKVKVGGAKRGRPKATAANKESPADDNQAPVQEKKPKVDPPPPRQHPCPECDLTFPGLVQLRAHKKEKHTPRKPHPCEECEESFIRPEQLEAHKARAHTAGRFACPTCGKSFGRESNMKSHQKSHPEEMQLGRSKKR